MGGVFCVKQSCCGKAVGNCCVNSRIYGVDATKGAGLICDRLSHLVALCKDSQLGRVLIGQNAGINVHVCRKLK